MNSVFTKITKLYLQNKILSISGKSATGKTTFALQLISNLFARFPSNNFSCLWIQASESFPKKRLQNMLKQSPHKLSYILDNIFIIPAKFTIKTYFEQKSIINKITNNNFIYPNCIIIDNISNHLRHELSNSKSIQSSVSILNDFFNNQLFPLVMFCEREGIRLLLIHEVSYNPIYGENKKSFHKLYERINSVNVFLNPNDFSQDKIMTIEYEKNKWIFKYQLVDSGFTFI
jgi:predicted ATP-dependent serine protease